MVSYEEAKKIALERTEEAGVPINWAGELPHAYIFDDADNMYDGLLPMVVRKADGKCFNYWHYMQQTNSKGDDIKDIPF